MQYVSTCPYGPCSRGTDGRTSRSEHHRRVMVAPLLSHNMDAGRNSRPPGACVMRASSIDRQRKTRGQATVEFAIVSIFLLLTVLGTIDFGRAIFLKSELENAVREAAREARTVTARPGQVGPPCDSIANIVNLRVKMMNPDQGGACNVGEHPRPGLQNATVTYSCSPSCTSGGKLTVTASLPFQAVTQEFLGISPLTLQASATVTLE